MNRSLTVPRYCAQNQIHILPNAHLAPRSHVLGLVGFWKGLTSEGKRNVSGAARWLPGVFLSLFSLWNKRLAQQEDFVLSPSEPRRRIAFVYTQARSSVSSRPERCGITVESICLCGDTGQQLEWGGWGRHWEQEGVKGGRERRGKKGTYAKKKKERMRKSPSISCSPCLLGLCRSMQEWPFPVLWGSMWLVHDRVGRSDMGWSIGYHHEPSGAPCSAQGEWRQHWVLWRGHKIGDAGNVEPTHGKHLSWLSPRSPDNFA